MIGNGGGYKEPKRGRVAGFFGFLRVGFASSFTFFGSSFTFFVVGDSFFASATSFFALPTAFANLIATPKSELTDAPESRAILHRGSSRPSRTAASRLRPRCHKRLQFRRLAGIPLPNGDRP